MSTDEHKRFAMDLMRAVDEVDIETLFRLLEALVVVRGKDRTREKYSKYFIAMDMVRMFGGMPEMTQDQLKRMIFYFRELLMQAFADGVPSPLPKYPGLEKVLGDGADGLNIFHLIALYTKPHPELAQGFVTATQKSGLWTKELIRVGLKSTGAIPLHVAAEANNRAVVEMLLKRDDSQVEIRNEEGMLPSEIAQAAGNSSMAAYLYDEERKYVCKKNLCSARDDVYVSRSSDSSGLATPRKEPEPVVLSGAVGVMQILGNAGNGSGSGSGADSESTSPETNQRIMIIENSETSANLEMLTSLLREKSTNGPHEDQQPRDPRQGMFEEQQAVEPAAAVVGEDVEMMSAVEEGEGDMVDDAVVEKGLGGKEPNEVENQPTAVELLSPQEDRGDDNRESEIQRLGSFIESVCDPSIVPDGDTYWLVYWEFVARMGITRLDKFLSAMKKDTGFAARFPQFFQDRVIDLMQNE